MKTKKSLFRKLDRVLTALVEAKLSEVDLDPTIEAAVDNFDFASPIERAVDSAVEDIDLRDEAKDAVADELRDVDLERKAERAVEQALEDQLPGAIEAALFRLLERPEVAERLVRALFDKASA